VARGFALLMINLDEGSQTQRANSLCYKLLDKAYCSTLRR
jgi:hypothetical protein